MTKLTGFMKTLAGDYIHFLIARAVEADTGKGAARGDPRILYPRLLRLKGPRQLPAGVSEVVERVEGNR